MEILVDDIVNIRKKELERKLIRSLAGNYKVSFKFVDTFATSEDYQYPERYFSEAKEVVLLLEDSENKISLLHLLYVAENVVIKHWRQDWIYENREFLSLVKDHEWKKIQISEEKARGTWTQKVYQVDDCPRYEGYGTWIHVDGRHFWESEADAALPRREITTRNDYNILRRFSHIEIFENGDWIIEQDNQKILRTESSEELICLEKGLETFTTQDYDSSYAEGWWQQRKNFWMLVQTIWMDFIAANKAIKITEDEKLYTEQFKLAEKFTGENFDEVAAQRAIRELLSKHVEGFVA
ncbi:MAG: hypothetical protein PHC38_05265 [Weeksellaceae bacterium]|nr:hypothetical protein [Weeksellaceae bacterium]